MIFSDAAASPRFLNFFSCTSFWGARSPKTDIKILIKKLPLSGAKTFLRKYSKIIL
jgi:hypothetical protein